MARTADAWTRRDKLAPVDFWSGIVCDLYDLPIQPGDPDAFVTVTRIADFSAYGLPVEASNAGSGAGLTRDDAVAAAVGEALERYACAVIHPEDIEVGSFRELMDSGKRCVAPEEWCLFAPHQEIAPLSSFEAHTVVGWVEADNLTERHPQWVPACLVYMPYVRFDRGRSDEQIISYATSTGLACAPTLQQALLGGIFEVIERDAFTIAWRNRLPMPRVVIDSESRLFSVYQDRFVRPGIDYFLFQTTLDLGIPSFFGFARDKRRTPPSITAGGAAHADPQVAVLKTLLELAQGMQWVNNAGGRTFPIEPQFRNVRSFDDRLALYALNDLIEAFDFLDLEAAGIPVSIIPPFSGGDPSVHEIVEVLQAQGLEVLALNMTPADIYEAGLHVVKVLIPQCEVLEGDHLLPQLGGSRWRHHAISEGGVHGSSDMNGYPHPYP
jgi:ribosomal protein S12 methylthiotransferase accessory factor